MVDLEILPSNSSTPYEPDLSNTWIADTFSGLATTTGGFIETLVDVLDDVVEGQEIAKVYNPFGDVLETIRADAAARVLQVVVDPATG